MIPLYVFKNEKMENYKTEKEALRIVKLKPHPVYSTPPKKNSLGGEDTGIVSDAVKLTKGMVGVYMINEAKPESNFYKTIYVGSSLSDLRKTMMRHFYAWNDTRQPNRVSYREKVLSGHSYMVTIAIFKNDVKGRVAVEIVEKRLIKMLKPRDNKNDLYSIFNPKKNDIAECVDCFNDSPEIEHEKFSRSKSGELLDEFGNVIF